MTNENLTVHFKVKDFNAWRTSYNGHEKIARLPASQTEKYSAAPTTPMTWCILPDVADVSKARTWYGSSEMKSLMEKSGVIGSPSIRFAAGPKSQLTIITPNRRNSTNCTFILAAASAAVLTLSPRLSHSSRPRHSRRSQGHARENSCRCESG